MAALGGWALSVLVDKVCCFFFFQDTDCHSKKSAVVAGINTFTVWSSGCAFQQGIQTGWGCLKNTNATEGSNV